MKYDKYGDPIVEVSDKLDGKRKTATLVMIALQAVLILANIVAMLIPGGVYMVFLTASLYIFFFIAYLKGCTAIKETGKLPTYCKATTVISPILYVLTAVLAVFSGF